MENVIRFKDVNEACMSNEIIKNALKGLIRNRICFKVYIEDLDKWYYFGGSKETILVTREQIEIPKNTRGIDYNELTNKVCIVMINDESKAMREAE